MLATLPSAFLSQSEATSSRADRDSSRQQELDDYAIFEVQIVLSSVRPRRGVAMLRSLLVCCQDLLSMSPSRASMSPTLPRSSAPRSPGEDCLRLPPWPDALVRHPGPVEHAQEPAAGEELAATEVYSQQEGMGGSAYLQVSDLETTGPTWSPGRSFALQVPEPSYYDSMLEGSRHAVDALWEAAKAKSRHSQSRPQSAASLRSSVSAQSSQHGSTQSEPVVAHDKYSEWMSQQRAATRSLLRTGNGDAPVMVGLPPRVRAAHDLSKGQQPRAPRPNSAQPRRPASANAATRCKPKTKSKRKGPKHRHNPQFRDWSDREVRRALEKACLRLDAVAMCREEIVEARSFRRPPARVHAVLAALHALLYPVKLKVGRCAACYVPFKAL